MEAPNVNPIDLTNPSPPTGQPHEDASTRRTSQGTKRKSTADNDDNSIDLSDIDVEGMPITDNADQVRRKISRLIENGGMKVGEFCKEANISNNAYNRFMHQHGPTKGLQSDVFMFGSAYFKKRELAGMKLPAANSKRAKTTSGAGAGAQSSTAASNTAATNNAANASSTGAGAPADFRQMHLPGEETDSVPVYDTAADVRRKISAHLREPDVTQAQFCRDLFSQLHGSDRGASIQTSQLQRFRGKSGANEGGDSKVFYAGYVFFEKKRIGEGKPKSKKRLEMEKIWKGGVDRKYFGRTT